LDKIYEDSKFPAIGIVNFVKLGAVYARELGTWPIEPHGTPLFG
jgi:hypothetical protein